MINVRGVRHSFGKIVALDDVNLDFTPGVTSILGPNGAGKTTLLRCIATVLAPDSGDIVVRGRLRADDPAERLIIRRFLGYMPQSLDLPLRWTVRQYLDYIAILKEIARPSLRRAAVDSALDAVDLSSRAIDRIASLSGGMKKRLVLAQCLVGDPPLLILDEPTSGLDPEQRFRFRELVTGVVATERVVIVSTHQTDDAAAVSNRVVVLNEGRVRFDGTEGELAEQARGHVWRSGEAARGLASWRTQDGEYRTVGDPPLGAKLLEPTIEDGYLVTLRSEP